MRLLSIIPYRSLTFLHLKLSLSSRAVQQLGLSLTFFSSKLSSEEGTSPRSGLASRLYAALFPLSSGTNQASSARHAEPIVTSPKVEAPIASQSHQAPSAAASPALQRVQRLREAEGRQAAQRAAEADVFIPLSKDAEQISGMLFKAAAIMISVPMAIWFVSNTLLVALCIRGLKSEDPVIVKLSLSRIVSFILVDVLATRFEQDEGVTFLVSLLSHQNILGNAHVMIEATRAVRHLLKFDETRKTLLLGMTGERLQRALERNMVAPEAIQETRLLLDEIEEMKRKDMEAVFGVQQ